MNKLVERFLKSMEKQRLNGSIILNRAKENLAGASLSEAAALVSLMLQKVYKR